MKEVRYAKVVERVKEIYLKLNATKLREEAEDADETNKEVEKEEALEEETSRQETSTTEASGPQPPIT